MSNIATRPQTRGTLAMEAIETDDDLVNALRSGIVDERFVTNGRVLPERILASKLMVSRFRLRRALDVLEDDGAIFRRRGQGTFAAPPPAVESGNFRILARRVTPQDVMEARLEVEPALAALAAQRASRDEIKMLDRLTRATFEASDTAGYDIADDVFHYKIAELAHNPLFLTIYQSISTVRKHADWTSRRHETYSKKMIEQLVRQHEDLFRSIAARDPRAAAETMEKHLITVSNAMLRGRTYGQAAGG